MVDDAAKQLAPGSGGVARNSLRKQNRESGGRKSLTGSRGRAIGVGAQSTLAGQDIFARKICMKN